MKPKEETLDEHLETFCEIILETTSETWKSILVEVLKRDTLPYIKQLFKEKVGFINYTSPDFPITFGRTKFGGTFGTKPFTYNTHLTIKSKFWKEPCYTFTLDGYRIVVEINKNYMNVNIYEYICYKQRP